MADKYIIDTITASDKELYLNNAVNAIEYLRNKISELNEMTVKDKSMPTMTEPHQVAFYLKDILNIPQRMNQEPNRGGMSGESYYITFIPVNKQDVVIELRISDHQRGEGYSDSYDNALHPNMRATTIVTKDDAEVPTIQTMPPHKCNGCKIKRIYQTVPTEVYGTPEQVIQHLKTLVCLFQNGYFGKYKKKKLKENNTKTQYNMKQKIRLTEGDLHRIIRNCVNEAIDKGNFWNNVQGALQGAVGGYKARQNFNNQQNWQNTLNQRGVPVDSPNRDGINANYQISKEINYLYQNVGLFADTWQKNGWGDVGMADHYITTIEGIINNIKQAFNSRTTRDEFGFARSKPQS